MKPEAMAIWDTYRAGKLTHFEAMQAFFSHAPDDPTELAALVRDTEPDPRFGDSVGALEANGWDLIVVSAGSSWYIERILQAAGVQVPIYSNPGTIVPGKGLVMKLADQSPFFCSDVGVDKSAVVRDALSRYTDVAFAGDGPPDLAPALLVGANRRFAKGFLAEELRKRGEGFVEFSAWSEIAGNLAKRA